MRAFFHPKKIATAGFTWLAVGSRDANPNRIPRRLASASALHSSPLNSRKLPNEPSRVTQQRFKEFDPRGKVFVVTRGGRGLGLAMASLWRNLAPSETLAVRCTTAAWTSVMSNPSTARSRIVAENSRLDGLNAAAGIQQIKPATA